MDKILDFILDEGNIKITKTIITLVVGYFIRIVTIKLVHKRVDDTKFYYFNLAVILYFSLFLTF